MSKNRNRAKLYKAKSIREYNVLLKTTPKNYKWYCPICSKRRGEFGVSCGILRWSTYYNLGTVNQRKKAITTKQARAYKTWKHNRKTQWK